MSFSVKISVSQDKHAFLRIQGYVDDMMKQLMELLRVDIPKWEGPIICESSARTSESSADIEPPPAVAVDEKVKKEERKREVTALTDNGSVEEEAVLCKKERTESPVEEKKSLYKIETI